MNVNPAPQDVTTGEALTLTIARTQAGTTAGLEIHVVDTAWCAPGTTFPSFLPQGTVTYTEGFPTVRNSSLLGHDEICTTFQYPTLNSATLPINLISPVKKATGDYTSVSGVITAETTGGRQLRYGSIICNGTHPCTLAAAVWVGDSADPPAAGVYFVNTRVAFLSTSTSVSCGGSASGQLRSESPDRLGNLITDLTLDGCQADVGGGKALTSNNSSGHGDDKALCTFAGGADDLAYSAVGYGTVTSPFNPANCPGISEPDRPYVAVPIALNAMVLSHSQTRRVTNPVNGVVFSPYSSQFDITDGQLAQLLGEGGIQTWNSHLGKTLVKENPTLVHDYYYSTTATAEITHAGGLSGVIVTSTAQATTLFVTSFLHTLVPTTMVSTTIGNPKLGVTADFGTTEPKYNAQPATGLVTAIHYLTPGSQQPFSLLSSSDENAIWGGQAEFALQSYDSLGSSTPIFVAPTVKTMQAAVADMTPQADGTLVPNPKAGPVDGKEPYPLTYVEYAIAPTQPLMTSACAPRTQSQQDLTEWLEYLTGAGQSELPKGMAPLTTSLQAQARAAIAEIGQAAPACVATTSSTGATTSGSTTSGSSSSGSAGPTKTTSTTTAETNSSGTGSSGGSSSEGSPAAGSTPSAGSSPMESSSSAGLGSSSYSSSGGRTAGASSTASSPTKGPGAHGGTKKSSAPLNLDVDLASFRPAGGTSWLWPTVGMLLLFMLLPGLVLLAAGRSPRQVLSRLGYWFRWGGHGGSPGGAS